MKDIAIEPTETDEICAEKSKTDDLRVKRQVDDKNMAAVEATDVSVKDNPKPETAVEESVTETRESATEKVESATDDQKSPTEDLESATEKVESAIEDPTSATGNQESPTENQESATENQESPSEDLESATENVESATETRESATENQESATEDLESATENHESAAENRESATEDQESAVENQESAAEKIVEENLIDTSVKETHNEETAAFKPVKDDGEPSDGPSVDVSPSESPVESINEGSNDSKDSENETLPVTTPPKIPRLTAEAIVKVVPLKIPADSPIRIAASATFGELGTSSAVDEENGSSPDNPVTPDDSGAPDDPGTPGSDNEKEVEDELLDDTTVQSPVYEHVGSDDKTSGFIRVIMPEPLETIQFNENRRNRRNSSSTVTALDPSKLATPKPTDQLKSTGEQVAEASGDGGELKKFDLSTLPDDESDEGESGGEGEVLSPSQLFVTQVSTEY